MTRQELISSCVNKMKEIDFLLKEENTELDFYKDLFGQKVYKISLDAGCTCPNRDGSKSKGGCSFCSANGSGDFTPKKNLIVRNDLLLTQKKPALSQLFIINIIPKIIAGLVPVAV